MSHRLTTPAQHAKYQADTEAHESAYIQALEHDAAWDPGDEPMDQYDPQCPDIFGSLIGPDEGAMQAWLSQNPDDETRVN
jgi:hypothetical protein